MEETQETTRLQKTLETLQGRRCPGCDQTLCDHQILCAVALGLKDAPRCPSCAAKGLHRDLETVRADLSRWLRAKECFSRVWAKANQEICRPCPWKDLLNPEDWDENESDKEPSPPIGPGPLPDLPVHDFGDMACGELVLELRRRLRELPPGTAIRVVATDPGAPQDIPAWIRLVGHSLIQAAPPFYDLRKRIDS